MKAEIISVDLCAPSTAAGPEQVSMLADLLSGAGLELVSLTHVRPNERDLEVCLKQALKRSHLTIITGGAEDLAKKTLSRLLDRRLILQGDLLRRIEEQHRTEGKEPPAGFEKSALMPSGAKAVIGGPGETGGPTGFFMEHKGRCILYLSALPEDASRALPEELMAHLGSRARPRQWRQSRVLRSYGIDRTKLSEHLAGRLGGDSSVLLHETPDGVDLKVSFSSPTLAGAASGLDKECDRVSELLGDYCYASGDTGMEEVVAGLLTEKRLTIATAESCTGGLIAKRLTDVPGSTAYMERGVVTYSNLSKVELIGVSEATLQAHGAVSEQTAREMAEGVRWNAKTDLGLAVTGIAGPTGGMPDKPVGLVYIAMATENGVTVKKCNFSGDREAVRHATSQRALDMVRRYLLS